jgi:Ran GTPase-activating protein (RanGAP) involved in mRNA processing and transport
VERSSLETLFLSSCQLSCSAASELCQSSTCSGLKTLDLSKNDIGEKSGLAIAEILDGWTSLRDLNLSNNEIGCIVCKLATSLLILVANSVHSVRGLDHFLEYYCTNKMHKG